MTNDEMSITGDQKMDVGRFTSALRNILRQICRLEEEQRESSSY